MAEELYHSFRRRTAAVISRGGALPPVNKAATPRPHTLGGCVGVVLKALFTRRASANGGFISAAAKRRKILMNADRFCFMPVL